MKHARAYGLVGIVGIPLLVLLGFALGRDSATEAVDVGTATTLDGAISGDAPLGVSLPGERLRSVAEAPSASSDRSPAEARAAAVLTGRLVDESGRPVADAVVSWSPVPAVSALGGGDVLQMASQVEAASRVVHSDPAGRFEFSQAPVVAPGEGSVVWATHPAHVAAAVAIEPSDADPGPRTITLSPAEGIAARVVASERNVEGARVWQIAGAGDADDGPSVLRQALVRSRVTGAHGRTSLFPFPGECGVVATKEKRRSRLRLGSLRGELTLPLHETFRASGSVRWKGERNPTLDPHVTVEARHGHVAGLLREVPVGEDGSWGPVEVPLVGGDAYAFRLEGDVVPDEHLWTPPPLPGEHVVVDLRARAGHAVWARVVDENEQTMFDAEVSALWRTPDSRWASVRAESFTADHDWAGHVLLRGVPDGAIVVEGRAPGYAPVRSTDSFEVPEAEPVVHELQLFPAAEVSGIVLHHGEPVPTFEVCYWDPDVFQPPSWRRVFSDREDGSFVLNDAPTGQLALLATAPGLPRSPATVLELSPKESAEVVLELPDDLPGRGRIVDALDGDPIPHAQVQRFSSHGLRTLAYWGPPVAVEPDGSFRLDGLVSGRNVIQVLGDGYASQWVWSSADADELDFGRIALTKKQMLRVELSEGGADELGEYRLDVVGIEVRNGIRVADDGTAEVGPLSPCREYDVRLKRGGTLVQQASVPAPAGVDWHVAFSVGGRRARVVLEPEDGQPLPSDPFVIAHVGGERGIERLVSAAATDGVAFLDGLLPGSTFFEVKAEGHVVGCAMVTLTGDGDDLVVVRLDASEHRFRIVDGSGNPVEGVAVYARHERQPTGYVQGGTSGPDGALSLRALLPGRHLLTAHHPTLGTAPFAVGIGARPSPEAIELVFEAESSLVATLRHADKPVPGATCRLTALDGLMAVTAATSGADGVARWEHLGVGPYTIAVEHGGYWPARASAEVTAGITTTVIQMLRRARLELEVVDGSGSPVAGVAAELEHEGLGTAVSRWIDDGLVPVPAGGLVTDAAGRLAVSGLPEGVYRWKARTPAGVTAAGDLRLDPSSQSAVRLSLP